MTSKEERDQIKAFVENEVMFAAIERILLPEEAIAAGLPLADDAEYGRAVRAWVGARELVKARLAELRRIASTNPQPQPKNEAR